MKKLAIVLLLVVAAGCRREMVVSAAPDPNAPGGATPREAIQRFMAAAREQNLQAMSNVWGTAKGPARLSLSGEELEKRQIVMMCYLKHDSYQVLGEAPAADGERVLALELKFRDLTRSTNFFTVPGPNQRWFVRGLDMVALQEICARK